MCPMTEGLPKGSATCWQRHLGTKPFHEDLWEDMQANIRTRECMSAASFFSTAPCLPQRPSISSTTQGLMPRDVQYVFAGRTGGINKPACTWPAGVGPTQTHARAHEVPSCSASPSGIAGHPASSLYWKPRSAHAQRGLQWDLLLFVFLSFLSP